MLSISKYGVSFGMHSRANLGSSKLLVMLSPEDHILTSPMLSFEDNYIFEWINDYVFKSTSIYPKQNTISKETDSNAQST